jgi:hypothetical protein
MNMTLENWVKSKLLERLNSDADEIRRLLSTADHFLEDYRKAVDGKLSADAQLDLAYGAIRNCATAALRAAGYRVVRGGNEHYYTIEALEFSIDPNKKLIPVLDQFRKKRNVGNYDDRGRASQNEADTAGEKAVQLRKEIEEWIRKNHPDKIKNQAPPAEAKDSSAKKRE